ncbi:16S rRNA (guanine(527)-N(7))-methyltransferase RsmG [Nocardioides caldifontis]|uniref:16S rRNA (guanine(527)-N(7))-methyltransferase RsmG n=1 Tax=Nocardioides caldifontis TaxID=2588938 RepID=UPI001EEF96E1|nr:16S rRNA (guanine(527)-N(7))-methyltransferase RsmG [Nocardioides caldifontis]
MFASALDAVAAYAELLAHDGTERGLIGPREVPRLWERHLLNCGVVTDVIPEAATVCDVGSGAGLPGLVIAIRRPDLKVTLLEPLARRTRFLDEVVEKLGLANVEVVRGRAEQLHGERRFDVVTSRAVARLPKLLDWSLPLVAPGGAMVAMKGGSAPDEVAEARPTLRAFHADEPEIITIGGTLLPFPTTVVRVRVSDGAPLDSSRRSPSRRKGRRKP